MERFLERMREKRNTALSRQINSTILILLFGIALHSACVLARTILMIRLPVLSS